MLYSGNTALQQPSHQATPSTHVVVLLLLSLLSLLQRGQGVEVNHKLSLELFRRAAELGDPEAQGMMGARMAVGLHHYNSFDGASIRHFGPVSAAGGCATAA